MITEQNEFHSSTLLLRYVWLFEIGLLAAQIGSRHQLAVAVTSAALALLNWHTSTLFPRIERVVAQVGLLVGTGCIAVMITSLAMAFTWGRESFSFVASETTRFFLGGLLLIIPIRIGAFFFGYCLVRINRNQQVKAGAKGSS